MILVLINHQDVGFPFWRAWLMVELMTPASPDIPLETEEVLPKLEPYDEAGITPDVLKSVTAAPVVPEEDPTETGVEDPVML